MFLGTENSCQILRSPTTKNHRNNLCIYATFLTFGKALGGIFVAWLLSWVDLTDAAEYQGWTVRRETSKKHHIWHSNCLWICSLDSRHILLWKTCWKHQGIISSCLGPFNSHLRNLDSCLRDALITPGASRELGKHLCWVLWLLPSRCLITDSTWRCSRYEQWWKHFFVLRHLYLYLPTYIRMIPCHYGNTLMYPAIVTIKDLKVIQYQSWKENTQKILPRDKQKVLLFDIITSKNGTYWKFLKHFHYRNRTISTNFDFASLSPCQKETVCWWETIIKITVITDKVLIWTFARSEHHKKFEHIRYVCIHICTKYCDFICSISSDQKNIWVVFGNLPRSSIYMSPGLSWYCS